jgi:hypothetical protein
MGFMRCTIKILVPFGKTDFFVGLNLQLMRQGQTVREIERSSS